MTVEQKEAMYAEARRLMERVIEEHEAKGDEWATRSLASIVGAAIADLLHYGRDHGAEAIRNRAMSWSGALSNALRAFNETR